MALQRNERSSTQFLSQGGRIHKSFHPDDLKQGDNVDYSKAIRLVRAACGLSQKDLALKTKLDPSYVCLIEAKRRVPRPDTLRAICKALGIPRPVLDLLASDKSRLDGIGPSQAKKIGMTLVHLLNASATGE